MNHELREISGKLDEIKREQVRDKHENLSYVLWGFTLAMVSLTITNPMPVSIVITVVFFIMGCVHWIRARMVKAGPTGPRNMTKNADN